MTDEELYRFTKLYFTYVEAVFRTADHLALCVELPRDVDKELTDRPFYWMWVETLRETPPPTVLYLQFSEQPPSSSIISELPENTRPERINTGSYRMQKIFQSTKTRGRFAVAYEHAPELWPSVLINVKISYTSDRQKDELLTYVVDLKTDLIAESSMQLFMTKKLSDELPAKAKIMPLPVNYDRILKRVLDRLKQDLAKKDSRWAKEATTRLQQELAELDRYYAELPEQEDLINEKILRKDELTWRMAPKIEIHPLQLALLYLADTKV